MRGETYRDSSGRTLADYPRPSVAVDAAVLTLAPEAGLVVLQVRRDRGRGWALPGTFLHPGETLADAVDRALRTKAGISGVHPRQLRVFDDPERDDRGWVLSVAHVAVVPAERLARRFPDRTRLMPVQAPGRLVYDHAEIIALAVAEVRGRYRADPDPDHLLGDEFTLRQLRSVHEAIAGHPLQRDTFRRAMEPKLIPTGVTVTTGRGRPAELFRRRGQDTAT
ncbi:NUDIX domain-containing protein [uncultured Mycolicibacterium sp.]|uniref:NUDIX hydrolase n=1 Tax=uncultured Mycolicibacterium sp. TaxID=2320817 RepID=UPI002628A672|nr:NUDIX domain-containing protein [uncultured Mycolicibacterium sp.]